MEKECRFLKVNELKSKTGSPYYLGSFCDERGESFKVFLSEDIFHSLTFLPPFTVVVLEFDFSVYKENLNLNLVNFFVSDALEY